jgi:hypothetical protein
MVMSSLDSSLWVVRSPRPVRLPQLSVSTEHRRLLRSGVDLTAEVSTLLP